MGQGASGKVIKAILQIILRQTYFGDQISRHTVIQGFAVYKGSIAVKDNQIIVGLHLKIRFRFGWLRKVYRAWLRRIKGAIAPF
jgi:hypothetical protein